MNIWNCNFDFFESGGGIVMCNELTQRKIDRTQAMNKG